MGRIHANDSIIYDTKFKRLVRVPFLDANYFDKRSCAIIKPLDQQPDNSIIDIQAATFGSPIMEC